MLTHAGFEVERDVEETVVFVLPDNEAWWRWAWSQGMREVLEALPPDALEEFREAAFARLDAMAQPDGLHLDQRARFVVARRPGQA